MSNDDPQKPLTLFEGSERIGAYSSEVELFSVVEPPDIDNYSVVDSRGSSFKICFKEPPSAGLLDKLADMLGAPVTMILVPKDKK